MPNRWPRHWPLQPIQPGHWARQTPTYADANPALINAARERAEARPSGNWFVFAASRDIRADRPYGCRVAGVELVAWRDRAGRLAAGPGACPHLGGPLALATVDSGALVCRWHGLRIDPAGGPGWRCLPTHDDGVLVWVRLDTRGGETPTDTPMLPTRPTTESSVAAVATMIGVCEPSDVIANRLDPWHGSWFHPYSFARLRVLSAPDEAGANERDDRFAVEVTFRVAPRLGVPVLAEFTCPEPRTVVMRILEGEGTGSVVETHATPLGIGENGKPHTAVIEAVIAYSRRSGFAFAKQAAPLLRPLMRRTAMRLWRDDLAYAQRQYSLRKR